MKMSLLYFLVAIIVIFIIFKILQITLKIAFVIGLVLMVCYYFQPQKTKNEIDKVKNGSIFKKGSK